MDEGGAVTEKYGANKLPKGIQRTVYIVDKQGIIRYARRGLPPDEELLDCLRQL